MAIEQVISALGWSTLAIVISQLVSVLIMSALGLPPKKLVHEIEDVQNPAVGASFFIISLAVTFYISVFFSDGYDAAASVEFGSAALWFILGLILSHLYLGIVLVIAHRLMDRQEGESVFGYIRRELVEEQNVSLAFFLGGLGVTPFIAMVFQII